MKKHFYDNIIEVDTLHIELDSMDFSDDERKHLRELIGSSLHHAILDAILSELSEDDKVIFLEHLLRNDHAKIWKHLNDKADNIEDKIRKAAESVKKELRKDIKESKNTN